MRVLLVEDDSMIGENISEALARENFAVDWVRDGQSAELALAHDVYDLLLLDLGLPKKQGIPVLQGLRQRGSALPVLIITARDSAAQVVHGLDQGADDYLVKPFELDVLYARVRALLRRRAGRAQPVIRVGELALDPATREVWRAGQLLPLSMREFALLQALLDPPGRVLSLAELEDKLYSWHHEIGSNAVEVHIHHLRKKLGKAFILNVRGVGYKVAVK